MEIRKEAGVTASGTPTAEQLEKINLLAKAPLAAENVYVFSVRLCDDQADRDFERFSRDALEQLAPMFVGKTGIVDHQWQSEKQLARIFETGLEFDGGAEYLKAWAYMLRGGERDEVIREIDAGIKKEVSVGCAMGKSICSVCGADYGACEHRKGQSYGGETCVAVLCEPTDAYEFSFVAVPAQKQAGVLKKLGADGFGENAELKRLQKEAELGRQYRKGLEQELVRLGLVLELGMDEGLLSRVAGSMDTADLLAAKKALGGRMAELFPPEPQLGKTEKYAPETDSAFLI